MHETKGAALYAVKAVERKESASVWVETKSGVITDSG